MTETTRPRAFFHLADLGGRGVYRAVNPFRALRHAGFDVELAADIRPEYIDETDIFVLQGTCRPEMLRLAESLHWEGKRVFLDLDEYEQVFPPARTEPAVTLAHCTRTVLRLADAVTVPTPLLARQLSAFNGNVTVVPSVIDEVLWERVEPKTRDDFGIPGDAVVLGCVVSESTAGRLAAVLRAVDEVMRRIPSAVFLAIGGEIDLSCLPDGRALLSSPATFTEYLATLPIVDVALAPLSGTLADRCRSPVVILEHGMAGSAVVADDVLPCRSLRSEGAPLLIAATDDEWVVHLETLARDTTTRRDTSAALERFVRQGCLLGEDSGYAALLSSAAEAGTVPVGG